MHGPRYNAEMRAWVFVVLGGCYAPQAAPGAPCGTGDQCPSGLECVQGVCELPGTLPTDATGDSTPPSDTAIDAGVSPDAPADAPPATLIAHWAFDDDPTDGAADSTDNGHIADCADHCPTLVTGRIGMAYHFDSSVPQYLVVPDAVDFRGPVTIALWFRTPDVSKAISMFAKPVGTGSDNSWQLENRFEQGVVLGGLGPLPL